MSWTGIALPVHHTKPYKNYNTSRYFGVWLGLGSFFPVVCFIHVFDQTLPEQLYLLLSGRPLFGVFI